jgi:hypothetical protein
VKVYAGIDGFPLYSVSNDGCVVSVQSGIERTLRQLRLPNGYMQVVLCHAGRRKSISVHRLVATAFVPNPNNLPHVNHRNGIKADNRDTNLEWMSQSQNVSHGYQTGLRVIGKEHRLRTADLGRSKRAFRPPVVRSIRAEFTGKRGQITSLARKHHVHHSVISDIVRGLTYGEIS